MPISAWSTTPGSNTSPVPNGAPEGMPPSGVNDLFRQQMADHKTQWLDAEWFNNGDTVSRASAATFKIPSDATTRYLTNRRIKCYDTSTLYGIIVSSSYGAPDTTVTVTLDSGSLSTSLSSVALAILSPTNQSIPAIVNLSVSGTASISGAAVFKTSATIEGAATVSGAAVMKTTLTVEGAATLSATAVCKTGFVVEGSVATIKGNSTQSGRLELLEDTDNGTNKVTVAAPAAITSDRVFTLPDCDLSQHIVQQVYSQSGAVATGTTVLPSDDTIPQNTEGDQYMTLAITPKNASNILVIQASALFASTATGTFTIALFQDTTANALAGNQFAIPTTNGAVPMTLQHHMVAGTTSATTFKIRLGQQNANTTTFNGSSGGRRLGGVVSSFINIFEISA